MIYVKLSAAYKKGTSEGKREYETIIKIGYCKDRKRRDLSYKTENPTIETKYIIKNGTMQDEKNLHSHFQDLKIYGNEWFKEDQRIYDFFDTHTTSESLQDLELSLSIRKRMKLSQEKEGLVEILGNMIYKALGKNLENQEEAIEFIKKKNTLIDEALESSDSYLYIKSMFPEVDFDTVEEPGEEIKKCLSKFGSSSQFKDKTKYLYNLWKDIGEIKFRIFLNFISTELRDYCNLIGIERIRSLSFQESEVRKDCIKVINNFNTTEELNKLIYSTFNIGTRYLSTRIKEMLQNLYQKSGYVGKPKAKELDKYFNIKPCLITNLETGKREHGFEILSLKI